ncbi:methyltransferase domain-containing protein [Mesorhizobium sp. Root552]|uniref:methyltransferase domain-containing protein n=1 Tax=Mesorhizobium sp. Root552 TaxID=1736555 RepID=UPI000B0DA0FA|nr:methyltransferase domain-containing protein [Mesorhizobium sp. Root552]
MGRKEKILARIGKQDKGLEIAPYHSPLAARSEGYNVRILDVFDQEELKSRALRDPLIPDELVHAIEEVDYVGSATEIVKLVPAEEHASFDYIVSSHNFEHLANPIKFLQGCEILLKQGGVLTMAVPDARACFDYFRPRTVLGEWLEAYFEDRQKPSHRQLFDSRAYMSFRKKGDLEQHAFHGDAGLKSMLLKGDLWKEFEAWKARADDGPYEDAHCTVMTPDTLRLLLTEAQMLGLVNLDIVEISPTVAHEFYVRLSKRGGGTTREMPSKEGLLMRDGLLKKAMQFQYSSGPFARPRRLLNKLKRSIQKRLDRFGG